MRKTQFANGEFYHIYNRGVDKRSIFQDKKDQQRFFDSLIQFNTIEPIGSIYENQFNRPKLQLGGRASKLQQKLVNIVSYCLNPNHYHFLLEQVSENGIQKFMHRLGTGYTRYFNDKNKRSGVLFQGKYKSIHITSNDYLLRLSSYINLNFKVHGLGGSASKSSWEEYSNEECVSDFCQKNIVLKQFKNRREYESFAKSSVEETIRKRKEDKEWESMLLE